MAAEALALQPRERAALALELLESLDGVPEADVDEAWDAEIRRRVTEVLDGKVEGEALDAALTELDRVVDEQA